MEGFIIMKIANSKYLKWVLKVIASYKVYSLTFSKSAKKDQRSILWDGPFIQRRFFHPMDRYNISVNNRADWRVECSGVRSSLVVMGILFKVASSLACCERFSMGQARATQLSEDNPKSVFTFIQASFRKI